MPAAVALVVVGGGVRIGQFVDFDPQTGEDKISVTTTLQGSAGFPRMVNSGKP